MTTFPTGTVTLFFTDVEGSTRLLEELGDDYDAALAEHHRIVRAALERHDGREVDTQGEAFFATFARATDAVAAAVEVQHAEHPFQVRMGLHTGQPRVGETGYVGLDVPRAARICAAGHGGQVLLSETTRNLVGDEHAVRDLGEHRLKDLSRPIRLYQLVENGLAETFPPLRTLESRPTNLPVQPTQLIGRERELAAVTDLLRREHVRLLTLTGAAGSGKTRLALQAAAEVVEDYADGVFIVPLEAVGDPALVVAAIAKGLGVSQTSSAPLADALEEFVRGRTMLLVLDNFEHLVEAASLLQQLVVAAPRIQLLVTSRAALRVSAEHEYVVPPLSLPDLGRPAELATLARNESVGLFLDRANAARPDFELTLENAPAVAEVCVRLDGLPLAIELAAARVRLLTPQAMVTRLGQRLPLLTGGARDLPSRQRTLRGAIDWSYELLDDGEKRLLERLAVFAGGCTLDAAESVCDATLDELESLIEKSLLRQQPRADEPRYSMFETIREYAGERLDELPGAETVRLRHAEHFIAWAEARKSAREDGELRGEYEPEDAEHENLQAAMAWARAEGQGEIELRLTVAMTLYWSARGHLSDGRRRLEDALQRHPSAGSLLQGQALLALTSLSWPQGDYEHARDWGEEALTIFAAHGDLRRLGMTHVNLGIAAEWRQDFDEEQRHYDEAERLFREVGNEQGLATLLNNRSYRELVHGNDAEAERLVREALALDPGNAAFFLLNLGLAVLRGDGPDSAAPVFAEALERGARSGETEILFYALEGLGGVAATRGDDGTAGRLWGASEAIRESRAAVLAAAERQTHDLLVPRSRSRLGHEAFEIAWAEGKAMPVERAIELALESAGGSHPQSD